MRYFLWYHFSSNSLTSYIPWDQKSRTLWRKCLFRAKIHEFSQGTTDANITRKDKKFLQSATFINYYKVRQYTHFISFSSENIFIYKKIFLDLTRSRRSQMFFKIGVLKNFANYTGEYLCWSLFLIKLQPLRPTTLLKRDFSTGCFLVKFAKFLKTPFFTYHF